VGIVGLVGAGFIRRLVTQPVAELREGTRRIADGDLGTRIRVNGRHELAGLAEAFNQMAEDLNASRREVMEWSQKLEEKVVEKTRELGRTQRQVLHMEKMASLGQLSATVAHELNNPIGGVLNYARLVRRELERQPLDDELRRELAGYLGLVEKECLRCGEIVRNLLLFAKRNGAEFAPVDLNEVVERSLMLVRHHFAISGVQVRCEPLGGNSLVRADSGQLQQALVALMVNADEAMKEVDGDKELSIRMRGDSEEAVIEVADTGVGIPAESLPHIYEPFFSTKETENRVGLGLAVVYGIVRRHGGTIDAESAVGQGTVFRIHLPREPQGQQEVQE
ncbi:MAG: sensor histidine kinase, partial [Thermoguttaceae bacterium]